MTNPNEMVQSGPAPPAMPPLPADIPVPDIATPPPTAAEVFLAWEKFRLAYNIILAVVVLFMVRDWTALLMPLSWFFLSQYALAANLCFCAGPWLEGWLALAGADRTFVRWLLFVPGTCLACALVPGTLFIFPDK